MPRHAGHWNTIRNLSDVSTSAVVFLGFRLSRRPPTDRYPYGLGRAEDLAGIGIAAVTWASAAFAGAGSIRKLLERGRWRASRGSPRSQ
jgi:divalent metal cation (Fe/Co/Zn/Cd) transporter